MARESDVRLAIRDALLTFTNAFSAVYLSGLPEDWGFGSSALTAAVIEPGGSGYATGWEAQAFLGGIAYDATCTVTVLARHEDAQLRDELAESLLDALAGVLNGSALAPYAIPGRTGIVSWQWQPATPPERRIQAIVGFSFVSERTDAGPAGGFNPFPTRTAHQLWDLLCATLKADPILAPRVRSWRLWRGDQDGPILPPPLIGSASLPALSLMPMASPGEWMDDRAHKFRWNIRVDLDIAGSDVRVAYDFWEALGACLFPDNNTLLNEMIALKAVEKTMSSAAYEIQRYADTSGYRASGLLTILKWLPS